MSHPFNQNNAGDNENLRAAVSQLQQERNRQMNQRGNMLSPQQQQMMGQGLLRPGANPNANLTSQLINMIQSPGSMGPNFNPYARPSGPQQNNRFQQFLPPFGGQPHHAGPFANPYGQNVGSPEERAARAQAQAQAAQFQNGPYGYGRQGQSQGLPNGSPNSQQFSNFEAAAAAARIQSQINMMKNSTGQGEAASSNDNEGDSGEKGKREGDNLQWPPPKDNSEYSLSEIINSLANGNRLSPDASSGSPKAGPVPTGPARASPSRGRGRGRGKGRGKGKTIMSLTKTGPDGTIIPIHSAVLGGEGEENAPVWYSGSVPLGLEEDQFWLSELQVYLRSNFAEAFGATEADIAAPMHGRNKPIALGQVGIRCIHCKDQPAADRGQQAVSYPSLISGIYNSVQQMFRLHFDCCTCMSNDVKMKIETLRTSSSSRGGRKQYWVDSAKRLGLVDTPHGIHFGRDPTGPLPPLDTSAQSFGPSDVDDSTTAAESSVAESPVKNGSVNAGSLLSQEHSDEMKRQKEEAYPLVLPEDKNLISDYLYLTLEQMEPCKLMDADRVGCYKGRSMGFRGLACKWCVGQAGCGRYFPASEASLSQTTTSQTILNHVRNCRRCPAEIRENLDIMKNSKTGPDGKKFDKPKHGGRKVFFHRLWCRIQGVPINEFEPIEAKIGRQKGAKNKKPALKRAGNKRKKSDESHASTRDDDETESEEEEEKSPTKKKRGRPKAVTSVNTAADYDESGDEEMLGPEDDDNKLYHACLPLTRGDDTHWLSELTCFVRKDMVEFFSAKKEDVELEDEEIVEGQVGVRCAFCARADPDDRPDGYSYFPKSLADIYQKVSDLQRRHFFKCSEVTADAKKSLTSFGGFASKAEAETHQFWVDSARELGITNYDNRDGLRFYRDPSKTSYADDITKERAKVRKNAVIDKKDLVRPTDVCTDEMYLLLKQVRPCRFKNSDRRVGPGSRGRDRALGFPGLACKHCPSKNTTGRFFPMTSKNLDNTINAMQGHVTSCSRCPESVKSGIAYLSHRSTLQKADLGTACKKTFCKDVWDRLHVERAWSSNKDVTVPMENQESIEREEPKVEENSEEVDEMVKAAAQWLTKRDNQAESANGSKPRASRGRGLPSRKRRDSNDGAP